MDNGGLSKFDSDYLYRDAENRQRWNLRDEVKKLKVENADLKAGIEQLVKGLRKMITHRKGVSYAAYVILQDVKEILKEWEEE